MRLPLDLPGSSSVSSNATPILTRIASSPIGLSAFYVFKSLFQQHQHTLQKRDVHVNTRHQLVVDLVLCVLSFVGALTIIVPYCLTKRSRKLRHSLILGLATSDLASSAIIISTNSLSLAGGNLDTAHRFCQFSGYMFQVTVWTQNLWNLAIAIITYMILVHPLSSFNAKVERYLIWLWPAFWIIAFAVNAVAWPVTNFGNLGGYCSFSPDRGGAYFAPVFNFIPRAFVVCVIIILYTHLFFFLRRVNLFNRVNSTRQQHSSAGGGMSRSRDSHRQRSLFAQEDAEAKESDEALVVDQPGVSRRKSTTSAVNMLYKWKRSVSQSTISPRGNDSPRQGSDSSQGKSSLSGPKVDEQQMPVLEMDERAPFSPKSKSSSDIPPSPTSIKKPQSITVPIIRPPPPVRRSTLVRAQESDQQFAPTQRRGSTAHFDLPDEEDDDDEDDVESKADNLHGLLDILQPMAPRRDARDFGMTSTPREHLKHFSLSPAGVDLLKKNGETSDSNDRTLTGQGDSNTEVPSYESMLGQNWTWGMPVGGGEKTANSDPTSPHTPSKHNFRLFGSRQSKSDHVGTGTNNSSSTDENGVESMGSTLNRQASILLLLYPGAYVILFSISIIRVIVDISNPDGSAASKMARNDNLLHTLSRWTIFAQGAIDALVFQFVERSFRMRMKRKRKIAAGELVPDFWFDEVFKRVKLYLKSKRKTKEKVEAST